MKLMLTVTPMIQMIVTGQANGPMPMGSWPFRCMA